jgi:hypothetical protein
MDQPREDDSGPVLTPPRKQGELPRAKTAWPNAVGIVGIVYAILMLMCSCGGLFTPQIFRWQADFEANVGQPDPSTDITADVTEKYQGAYIVAGSLSVLSTTVLLVSSIALVRRRRWSRAGLLTWIVVEVVLTFANLALHHRVTRDIVTEMQASGLSDKVSMAWWSMMGSAIGVSIVGMILPLFLLAWLNRSKIKHEINGWT